MLFNERSWEQMENQTTSAQAQTEVTKFTTEFAVSKLRVHLEAQDLSCFMLELGALIKARGGYNAAARAAGLNRTALYKIASAKGNPELNTLVALLAHLDLRLSIQAAQEKREKP